MDKRTYKDRKEYLQAYGRTPQKKAYNKKWRKNNLDRCRGYSRKAHKKPARKNYEKQWRLENPNKCKQYRKTSYLRNDGAGYQRNWRKVKPNGAYCSYKINAKKMKRSFTISLEYFSKFWQKPCFYCGGKIKTIGLDRVNNNLGYIKGNLRSCCHFCNSMKSKHTEREFYNHILKIVKQRKLV